VIALVLLAHVAQRVERAALVELVDRDQVGEVEHVDLLELRRGAVFGRHHVERDIAVLGDLGVGLADTGRLEQHQVITRRAHDAHRLTDVRRQREVCLTRRQRAHVAALMVIAFMRMRSPSSAPPVFRLDGSTEMTAMRLSS
jgi:hypothetical protein